jgi:predicted unusual protein kinase regulating ubiquinone biosynthesis (AarF/ABC1/UbiB family)
MPEQRSIPRHKITRALALANSGARLSGNYLKYRAKKALTGQDDRAGLHAANAASSYATLSQLKGAPLKVAQMLSIDQNLLPEPYAKEYAQAQYSAPPLSYPLVAKTFRQAFGKSPDELFDRFDKKAVSGASIGQIHRAWLDGKPLAVKVQYPGVADSLKSDLRLIRPFVMRMFDLKAVELDYYMAEVEERLLEETDYRLELKRSIELSQASGHLTGLRFPNYYPELSRQRILTMDWLEGETLDRFADACVDELQRNSVGQALWDFYHFQIHTLRIFHADPHPGNFLVHKGQLGVLDFGCVKAIPDDFYHAYFRLLDAEIVQNCKRFDQALRELTLLLPGDKPKEQVLLREIYRESVELLGQPYQVSEFDFGDPAYMEKIRAFGERTSNDKRLKKLNSARGSRHSLYVNRAYFGLYGLMSRLRCVIRTELPCFEDRVAV